jgi:hypothetical protein
MNSKFTKMRPPMVGAASVFLDVPAHLTRVNANAACPALFVQAALAKVKPATPTERPGTIAHAAPVRVAIAEPRAR